MKTPLSVTTLLAAVSLLSFNTARGAVIVTLAEDPDFLNSTLSNTHVFDFNSLSTGMRTDVNWSGVGSFDQLFIKNADVYGGAYDALNPNGTRYSVQGVGTPVNSTTLTLSTDSGYFGMWWSAGDAANVLSFYSNGNLLAEFTTANLLSALSTDYYGNPRNRNLNSSEPFAFINFFGDANTKWDQIVLRNNAGSGFESDNYTSRVTTYNPGTDGPGGLGIPVARVEGTTTTKVTPTATGAELWGSESAVPGAPAPPLPLLAAFGVAVLLRNRRAKKKESDASTAA